MDKAQIAKESNKPEIFIAPYYPRNLNPKKKDDFSELTKRYTVNNLLKIRSIVSSVPRKQIDELKHDRSTPSIL